MCAGPSNHAEGEDVIIGEIAVTDISIRPSRSCPDLEEIDPEISNQLVPEAQFWFLFAFACEYRLVGGLDCIFDHYPKGLEDEVHPCSRFRTWHASANIQNCVQDPREEEGEGHIEISSDKRPFLLSEYAMSPESGISNEHVTQTLLPVNTVDARISEARGHEIASLFK